MKRKITALLLAAGAVMLAGCSGQKDNGGTGLESESSQTTQQTTTAQPTQEAPPESTAPAQTESAQEQTAQSQEQAAAQESSEETVSVDVNVVSLITAYDNTFLGLPSPEKVYIFKDMLTTEDIDGRTFHQVDANNEEDGTLY